MVPLKLLLISATFFGVDADTRNECLPNPCHNGGSCSTLAVSGTHKCDCVPPHNDIDCRFQRDHSLRLCLPIFRDSIMTRDGATARYGGINCPIVLARPCERSVVDFTIESRHPDGMLLLKTSKHAVAFNCTHVIVDGLPASNAAINISEVAYSVECERDSSVCDHKLAFTVGNATLIWIEATCSGDSFAISRVIPNHLLPRSSRFSNILNIPLCGVVGNFDGDPENDLLKVDGTIPTDANDWFDSWALEAFGDMSGLGDNSCVFGKTMAAGGVNQQWAARERKCKFFTAKSAGFDRCYAVLERQLIGRYYNICLNEVGSAYGKADKTIATAECNAIKPFAELCASELVKMGVSWDWRKDTGCPEDECGGNEYYDLAGSVCTPTCGDPAADIKCPFTKTIAGCRCDSGHVRINNACVSFPDGCFGQGQN